MTPHQWDPKDSEHVWPGMAPPTPQPPQGPKPEARGLFGLPWLARIAIVIGVFAAIVVIGRTGATPTSSSTSARPYVPPAVTKSFAPPVAAPAVPMTTFTDGTYEVGRDIAAGTYVAPGATDRGCYWQRSSSADGTVKSIIANDNNFGGQVIVSVSAGEFFLVKNCGTWTKR